MTFKEITILSMEEHKRYRSIIPRIYSWWWLRSPGYIQSFAAYVDSDENIVEHGSYVDRVDFAFRPALKLELEIADNLFWYNPEKLIGTKIEYGKYRWTILDASFGELYTLCDAIMGYGRFDTDSNDWETSELKQWLKTEGLRRIIEKEDIADDC